MLQRLGLAQAILHDPKVVILDEPMSGLESGGTARSARHHSGIEAGWQNGAVFHAHFAGCGNAVRPCRRGLSAGKLRGVGAPDEIVGMKAQAMEVFFEYDGAEAGAAMFAEEIDANGKALSFAATGSRVIRRASATGHRGGKDPIGDAGKATLEEYFMHLVEADRAQAPAVEVSGK